METANYASPELASSAVDDFAATLAPLDLKLTTPSAAALLTSRRTCLSVLRTKVDCVSGDEVLSVLSDGPRYQPRHLCYVNAHSLNLAYRDAAYGDVLSRADLVLNDGIGLQLAARMRGKRFLENLNGSDFTLRLLNLAAREGWGVFLYGGHPGVAAAARDRLCETIDGLDVVDTCDGYGPQSAQQIVGRIRRSGADVVIVALGQPAQELWLDEHLTDTGCHLGVGVGAFLDFASGRVVRAPEWMNRCGMEWLFRLVQEPGRLWRRYIVGNPLFLWRAWNLREAEID